MTLPMNLPKSLQRAAQEPPKSRPRGAQESPKNRQRIAKEAMQALQGIPRQAGRQTAPGTKNPENRSDFKFSDLPKSFLITSARYRKNIQTNECSQKKLPTGRGAARSATPHARHSWSSLGSADTTVGPPWTSMDLRGREGGTSVEPPWTSMDLRGDTSKHLTNVQLTCKHAGAKATRPKLKLYLRIKKSNAHE